MTLFRYLEQVVVELVLWQADSSLVLIQFGNILEIEERTLVRLDLVYRERGMGQVDYYRRLLLVLDCRRP